MMEIEIKVKVKDPENLRKMLEKKQFKLEGTGTNKDTYYTIKHRDFMATKECLRVRDMPEKKKVVITYKPASSKAMIQEKMIWKKELETTVGSAEVIEGILEAIDAIKLVVVEKMRESYVKEDIHATIDQVKGVGCFMEIEKMSNDVEKTKRELWTLLGELGFTESDIEVKNYRDLVMRV